MSEPSSVKPRVAFVTFVAFVVVASSAAIVGSCAPATSPSSPRSKEGSKEEPSVGAASSESSFAPGPKKALTVAEARRAMLALINRDRATQKLAPVELDEGAAQSAAQRHAEDMAKNGFLGHWGSDGSVPEQRYTEAGGADFVHENALCFTDQKARTLDREPRIDPEKLEKSEGMFFNEVPPNDGHRKNILKPQHKKVGIGIAQPLGTDTEIAVPCFAQEFVDSYGTYAPLPKKAKVGSNLRVEGDILAPATFGGIGIARVDMPRPLPVSELNARRTYPIPNPYQMYWPPGFRTPLPIQVHGAHFSLDLPMSDRGKPGLYEISIWARLPSSADFVMVSLRTLRVES